MDWMLMPLRRYAQFGGRARPKEFWMFVLFLVVAFTLLSALETMAGLGTGGYWFRRGPWWASTGYYTNGGPLTGLFALAVLIPYVAVAVRRLHDSNHSGWWLLIGFVPVIGTVILLVFLIMGGTRGPNRFGPDPVDAG